MSFLFDRKAGVPPARLVGRGALLGAILGALLLTAPLADAGGDATIAVPVSIVRSAHGQVFIALYEQNNWLQPGRYLAAQKVPAKRGTVVARFNNLPRGRYAVAVWHDENANNRVDTNALGLPKEGYGFSRVTPRRKPRFDQVAVMAAPVAYAPIELRY
jgi:uncharacterized protein (DUF2141 family)